MGNYCFCCHSFLNTKPPSISINHPSSLISFSEFFKLFHTFSNNLLNTLPIATEHLSFYSVYETHLKVQRTDLHQLHWGFDVKWRDFLDESHYPFESFASILSPALKQFRNLRLTERVLITDERTLNYFNIIKQDLIEDGNRVESLVRSLNKHFKREVYYKFLMSEQIRGLNREKVNEMKLWVVEIIKKWVLGPICSIIRFLYDKIISLIAPSMNKNSLEDQLYAITEELVFGKGYCFYDGVQNLFFFENHENRKLLREKRLVKAEYKDLNNKSYYEIGKTFYSINERDYDKLTEIFGRLFKIRTSYSKIRTLYQIQQELMEILRNSSPNLEENDIREELGADNLVPLFIYIIQRNGNWNLHQEISFCECFAREGLQYDYLFCICKSALEYVTITE